jgi:hypothetical protein
MSAPGLARARSAPLLRQNQSASTNRKMQQPRGRGFFLRRHKRNSPLLGAWVLQKVSPAVQWQLRQQSVPTMQSPRLVRRARLGVLDNCARRQANSGCVSGIAAAASHSVQAAGREAYRGDFLRQCARHGFPPLEGCSDSQKCRGESHLRQKPNISAVHLDDPLDCAGLVHSGH